MINEKENYEAGLIAKNGINAELNTTNDYGNWVLQLKEMYEQTGDVKYLKAARAISDISKEELVHAGEFSKILSNIDPEVGESVQEGMEEVGDSKIVDADRTKIENVLASRGFMPIKSVGSLEKWKFREKDEAEFRKQVKEIEYAFPHLLVTDYISGGEFLITVDYKSAINDLDGTVNDPKDPLSDSCKDGIFEDIINGGLNFMNTVSKAGEIDEDPFAKVNDAFKSDELVRIISDKFNRLGKATIEKHVEDLKKSNNYRNLRTRLIWDVIRATSSAKEIVDWYDKYDANDDHITSAGRKALKNLGISVEDNSIKDTKMTVDRMVQIITPIVRDFAKKKGVEDYWAIHKNGKNVSVGIELGYRSLEELCDLLNKKLEPITESYFEPADAGLIETTVFDAKCSVNDSERRVYTFEYEEKKTGKRHKFRCQAEDDEDARNQLQWWAAEHDEEPYKIISTNMMYDSAIKDSKVYFTVTSEDYSINEIQRYIGSYAKVTGVRNYIYVETDEKNAKLVEGDLIDLGVDFENGRITDSAIKDETIKTPRGTMQVSEKTEEELKKEGYGYWFTAEVDGKKYKVLNNGTLAIAVRDAGYTLGEKYRWQNEYGNLPLYLVKIKGDEVKLNANGKIVVIPKDKFENYLENGTITPVSAQDIEEYNNIETLKDYKVKVGDRTFIVRAKDAKDATKKLKDTVWNTMPIPKVGATFPFSAKMNESDFNKYIADLKIRYNTEIKIYNQSEDGIRVTLVYMFNKHIATFVPNKQILYTDTRI